MKETDNNGSSTSNSDQTNNYSGFTTYQAVYYVLRISWYVLIHSVKETNSYECLLYQALF